MPRAGHGTTSRVTATSARLALLADLGGLAAKVAQVVELRATHIAASGDLDLRDDRRMHREGALDTDAEADLAHRERLADSCTVSANDHALEDLNTRPAALGDPHVHLEGV